MKSIIRPLLCVCMLSAMNSVSLLHAASKRLASLAPEYTVQQHTSPVATSPSSTTIQQGDTETQANPSSSDVQKAGMGLRFMACCVGIVLIPSSITRLIGISFRQCTGSVLDKQKGNLIKSIISAVFYALSLEKDIFGMEVVDQNGARISVGMNCLRTILMTLPSLMMAVLPNFLKKEAFKSSQEILKVLVGPFAILDFCGFFIYGDFLHNALLGVKVVYKSEHPHKATSSPDTTQPTGPDQAAASSLSQPLPQ